MKPVTRRSVMAGSAAVIAGSAAAAAVPIAAFGAAIDPNRMVLDLQAALRAAIKHVTPITPAEYLAEMEANGWLPVRELGATVSREGCSNTRSITRRQTR